MQTVKQIEKTSSKKSNKFPKFDLKQLLQTVFKPKTGEKLCILIDLENPRDIVDFKFLKKNHLRPQKKAYQVFYQELLNGIMQQLKLEACDFFAYQMTGGSNLELPETVTAPNGTLLNLTKDIYSAYDIILCIGSYSATAPLTAAAKKHRFRGATMHGVNDTILQSGLAVDYKEVSRTTELLRKGMTNADWVEIDFEVNKQQYHLHIDLEGQEAQKSHGLCPQGGDVVNLPAGEVYFVPKNASGNFPMKFEEDGTLAVMHVDQGKITKVTLIQGDQELINKYQRKFVSDPATGILGELGFGTQPFPYAESDIQDEKIFGTFHLAIGRNDHLNGDVTKERFIHLRNASHNDILFSSTKTPEIHVSQVKMKRHGNTVVLIKNYEPTSYLLNLLNKS